MNTFIEKLDTVSDTSIINNELQTILKVTNWSKNQIGLRHRANAENIWSDSVGSMYDYTTKSFKYTEADFNNWSVSENTYVRQQIELLSEKLNFKVGRVRFMKLLPHCGLSIHYDNELRYHLVIDTNPKSYICVNNAVSNNNLEIVSQCYHIPKDNHWYKVNTKKIHWVYNGGETERIHLVVCET